MMAGMMLWMLLWGLVGVVMLTVGVLGAIRLARNLSGRSGPRPPAVESPEEILRRRYAAGEIDEDEFFRRQSGLS